MSGKPGYEVPAVEALLQHLIKEKQAIGNLTREEVIDELEVVLLAEDIQVLADVLVSEVASREADHLVEDGKGIAHTAVGLLRDESKRLGFCLIAFFLGNIHQVVDGVLRGHSLEVIHLAATQDGGKYLVLLGGTEDEDDVGRRFLEGLEESIEGRWREHVHLVDDEDLVLARLRRDEDLLAKLTDIVNGVVAGSIEFMDVHGALLVEGLAALAFATRFPTLLRVEAIDGLRKDTGASGLTHASRPAEEIGMSQFARTDGILQRRSQRALTNNGIEVKRTIFECRNDVFFHLSFTF